MIGKARFYQARSWREVGLGVTDVETQSCQSGADKCTVQMAKWTPTVAGRTSHTCEPSG
jgi:hypothetical protein